MTVRLNLGSGPQPYKHYLSVDFDPDNHPDILHDLTQPLPFEDNSVDEMFASHVVEHFPLWQIPHLLRDWHRALRRGGVFWGFVPDGPTVARAYLESVEEKDKELKRVWLANFHGGWTNNEHTGRGQVHYALYDRDLLYEMLTGAGFPSVEIMAQSLNELDHRLVFIAIKGHYTPADIRWVGAYPSVPGLTPPWEEHTEPGP